MKCPKCHHDNHAEQKFCGECGNSLVEASDTESTSSQTESERKQVSVLFSDLSGYTAMTQRLDPEEVREIMDRIFGKIRRIVNEYGGFIEKYVGDSAMAVFGVPTAHEDDPIRAIRAATEIHAEIEAVSPEVEEKTGRPLSMHSGINTGLVITGQVDRDKGTHGLIGDTIALASRLEGLADDGQILVGETTYCLSNSYFNFDRMEPTKVKGKSDPMHFYKLLSAKKEPSAVRHLHGVRAKLIGRQKEMGLLTRAVEDLKGGRGGIISLIGNAGTGKSRLVLDFKETLDVEEIQWREGHAYPYTHNTPYYPLINLLIHAFRIQEGDNPEAIGEKVEAGIKGLLWDRQEIIPYIGSLFSLSYPEIENVNPEFLRARIQESVLEILEALASRGPTVLWFEDLHWSDSAFIDLLHILLTRTKRPVVFLLSYRPVFHLFPEGPPGDLNWLYDRIVLQDLSLADSHQMLKSLLGDEDPPVELETFIGDQAEGNPFYLEEVINSLIETGILVRENSNWLLTRQIAGMDIPTTIKGVLTARIDRLEKEAKRILQEASVIGRAFFYEVLSRITQLNASVDQHLSGLESLDFIRAQSREPDLEYIFKHALTQEVVYNGLLKKERQVIHERIGLTMEKLFANRIPEFYETLAFHFSRGKSTGKAIKYLIDSGEKCLNRFAVEESHHYFNEAFRILENKEDKTIAENKTLVDLLCRWGLVYYYRGAFIEYERLMLSQEKFVETIHDKKSIGLFHAWQGLAYWCNGELHEAYDILQKAKHIGETISSDLVIGYACTWLSWVCGEMGRFIEGIAFGEKGNEIAKKIQTDRYLYFKSLAGIAYNYSWTGNPEESKPIVESLIEYGNRHGDTRCLVLAYNAKGFMYAAAGDLEAAISWHLKAGEVAEDPFYSYIHMLQLCFAYIQAEQMEKVEILCMSMSRFYTDAVCKYHIAAHSSFLGFIQIGEGELSRGMKALFNYKDEVKKMAADALLPVADFFIAKVYMAIVKGEKPVPLSIMVKNFGFVLKHALFAAKLAEKHLMEAVSSATAIGAVGFLAQAHLELGILHKIKKRYPTARNHLEEAISIFQETGAYAFLKQAKDELSSIT